MYMFASLLSTCKQYICFSWFSLIVKIILCVECEENNEAMQRHTYRL